jgi:hypothetical protein
MSISYPNPQRIIDALKAALPGLPLAAGGWMVNGPPSAASPTRTLHPHPSGEKVFVAWTQVPTPAQIAQVSAAVTAYVVPTEVEELRAQAKDHLTLNPSAEMKLLRATVGIMVDEINVLREWLTSFQAAVAAAATLAALKTSVAALTALPDRTLAQAKTALGAKLDTGVVD